MAQSKSKTQETEIMLVSVLNLQSVLENNDLLFEAIALARFTVIQGKKKIMIRNEEVAGVEIKEKSVIIHLRNNQTIEAE